MLPQYLIDGMENLEKENPTLKQEWERDKDKIVADFHLQHKENIHPICMPSLLTREEPKSFDCMCSGCHNNNPKYNFCSCSMFNLFYKYRYHIYSELYLQNEKEESLLKIYEELLAKNYNPSFINVELDEEGYIVQQRGPKLSKLTPEDFHKKFGLSSKK